ncbi:MAG: RNA polymerase sigma factor [Chitinophagaceae bacterium]|nr:RNA polymerase sigma factor [Oligoflexus sp.]
MAKSVGSSLEDLLVAYSQGDDRAFQAFFDRTKDIVFNFVYPKVKNREAAEDIVQETLLRVHRYVTTYNAASGPALGWLLMIARNCLFDYYKSEKNSRRLGIASDLDEEGIKPNNTWEEKIFFAELLKSMAQELGQEEIDLLVERFVVELSYGEIALKLSLDNQNVRQRVSRLLRKARAVLIK